MRIELVQLLRLEPQLVPVTGIFVISKWHDGIQPIVPAVQLNDDECLAVPTPQRIAKRRERDRRRTGGTGVHVNLPHRIELLARDPDDVVRRDRIRRTEVVGERLPARVGERDDRAAVVRDDGNGEDAQRRAREDESQIAARFGKRLDQLIGLRRDAYVGDVFARARLRFPLDVLQHEDFTLLRRQLHQRELQGAAPLCRFRTAVGPIRGRYGIGRLQRGYRPATPPLRETAIAQNKEEPPDELVGILTLRQLIVRAHERVLHSVFRGVGRAQHPRGIARVAVAIPFHQRSIALAVTREHCPNDLAIRLGFRAHPLPPLKSG